MERAPEDGRGPRGMGRAPHSPPLASPLLQGHGEDAFVGEDPEVLGFGFDEQGPEPVHGDAFAAVGQWDGISARIPLPEMEGSLGVVRGGAAGEEGDGFGGRVVDGPGKADRVPSLDGQQRGPGAGLEVEAPKVVQGIVSTVEVAKAGDAFALASRGISKAAEEEPLLPVRAGEK